MKELFPWHNSTSIHSKAHIIAQALSEKQAVCWFRGTKQLTASRRVGEHGYFLHFWLDPFQETLAIYVKLNQSPFEVTLFSPVPQATGGKSPYVLPHLSHPFCLQERSRRHPCWTGRPNLNISSLLEQWMGVWVTIRRQALPW